ncbi:MAG: DUF455 family protein [Verrucomicrobiales bacterium]
MMTVREFAERVLHGTSLEEKLAPPPVGGLEDVARGRALAVPDLPGRPPELKLVPQGVRAEFPGTSRIEDDRERGRLLHFFANHELLATELMALVLLKFPDAPAEFRAGVLKTLKEEQMHTKLYLRRMEACGVAFGELPVNGFFWDLVAPMSTPLDYVTRLSLTFEQANLDYSRGYAKVFAEAGDADTSAVLQRIYQDEIRHVHYGLSWFRRWHQGASDWKSFCSLMSDPLSAARAKGAFEFNEEGRRAAGLDEEFIRELRVFSRSKGRTPDVFWFNPEAEEEIAGKPVNRAMEQVMADLEMVMVAVAKPDDVVMVRQVPPLAQREALQRVGVKLPELVAWEDLERVRARKLGQAKPWAATVGSSRTASVFGLRVDPVPVRVFSKIEHAKFLAELISMSDWDLLGPPEMVGEVVSCAAEVDAVRVRGGWNQWLLKAPVSTAGRDRMRLPAGSEWGESDRRRFDGMCELSSSLLMEPWLDRVLDFSIQYDCLDRGLVRRGMVVLENTERGQFLSARATRRPFDGLSVDDRRQIFAGGGRWASWMEEVLEPSLAQWLGEYRGPVGVDALLFRDPGGALRMKPVVEINPRYTMGRVAVEWSRARGDRAEVVVGVCGVEEVLESWATPLTVVDDESRLLAYVGVAGPSGKR